MEKNNRKIVLLYPAFTDKHKKQISECAEKYGFSCIFCVDREKAVHEAEDAEIVLAYETVVAKAAKKLKWVCTPSAGVDHYYDLIAGTDILLTNSSGAHSVTISEHIIMVTLEVMRKRMEYVRLASERKWEIGLPVRSIHGSRIVMAGTGNIGQETAKKLRAFEPESIIGINKGGSNPDGLFDRIVPLTEIDSILPETDLLIMSLPSTSETKRLMTEERLRKLPVSAYLVNVGRGDAIDEKALERILREGRLGGAALDVFEKEPLEPDNTLWECPNLVLTTHVAGNWTLPYTVDKVADFFTEDLINYCEGRPLNKLIDINIGY